MNFYTVRTPMMTLAALALSGGLALAQPPTAPAQPPAPVERQPPMGQMGGGNMGPGNIGMHRGMGYGGMQGAQGGPPNFAASRMEGRGDFHGGGGFHGGPGGHGMEGGFHIGPGGMWWKNPMIVQRLTLTPEQGRKMDSIFQESRLQLIDLKANVEKQEVILEPLLSANPLDSARAMEQIDKVAQSRADLEKANAKMLLGIRAVLTPEQWTKLNDRREPGEGRPQAGAAAAAAAPRTRGPRGGGGGNSPNARPNGASPQ